MSKRCLAFGETQVASRRSCSHGGPSDGELVEYGTRRWLIVLGVMSATHLQVLDATIVNVALPTIQGNTDANFDEGACIVTG
jgi:hypothetical protein